MMAARSDVEYAVLQRKRRPSCSVETVDDKVPSAFLSMRSGTRVSQVIQIYPSTSLLFDEIAHLFTPVRWSFLQSSFDGLEELPTYQKVSELLFRRMDKVILAVPALQALQLPLRDAAGSEERPVAKGETTAEARV